MSIDEKLKGLSDELKAKLEACKTKEELEALIKAEALTDEQLEVVSGGLALSSDFDPHDGCLGYNGAGIFDPSKCTRLAPINNIKS